MQQTGYILLADISGYTEFVTQTEIDHGSEIMQSLTQIVVDETKLPFQVLEIEGDAVFSHAGTEGFGRGVLLVEMIENMYSAFRQALEDSHRSTTCTCRACKHMGSLDLKFIVHHGSYTARSVGGHEGIAGPDVILAHRLLKNDIIEKAGCEAYALFTDAAIQSLGIQDLTGDMKPHEETYEHLGVVRGFVDNMGECWARKMAERNIRVEPEDSWLTLSETVPVSRAVAWEYFADPQLRQQWTFTDSITMKHLRGGRDGAGTIAHCVHGKNTILLKTLDWKPLQYATSAVMLPFGGLGPYTFTFEEDGDGTCVTLTNGGPIHKNPVIRRILRFGLKTQMASLKRNWAKEMEAYFAMLRVHHAQEATKPALSDTQE